MTPTKRNQQILYSDEARNKLSMGLNLAAKAAGATLGAGGRNILINENHDEYHITKDGVTVVKSLQHKDQIINIGILIAKDVAEKTVNEVGDGTTSSVILADAVYSSGLRKTNSDLNPIEIKQGLDIACKKVIEYLDKQSTKIKSLKQITNVALVSTNNDADLSNSIGKIFHENGKDCVIEVKPSATGLTYVEETDGLRFDRGYVSHGFLNEPTDKSVILNNPYILLTDQKISDSDLISNIITQVIIESQNNGELQRPILIVAEDVDNEALTTLVMNKKHRNLSICCVKAPDFGLASLEKLEDMASLTGATVITKTTADSLLDVTLDDLGVADKVTVTRFDTTIKAVSTASENSPWTEELTDSINKSIRNRIAKLESQKLKYTQAKDLIHSSQAANDRFKLSKLKKRIASLQNGLTTLFVGGYSEIEIKERIDRADDAIGSVRAALNGGIIPGAGVTLLRSTKILKKLMNSPIAKNKNIHAGIEVLLEAVTLPAKLILQNATGKSELVLSKILNSKSNNTGFDVRKHKMVDLISTGIIDPVDVTKSALTNAVSIAGSLLTTECVVSYNINNQPLLHE